MDWFAASVAKGVTVFLIDNTDYTLSPRSTATSSSTSSRSSANPSYLIPFMRQYLDELPDEGDHNRNFQILATCTSAGSLDPRLLLPTNALMAHIEKSNDQQRKKVLQSFLPVASEEREVMSESVESNLDTVVSQTKGSSISELILLARNAYHDSVAEDGPDFCQTYLRNLLKYAPASELNPSKDSSAFSIQDSKPEAFVGISSICNHVRQLLFSRDILSSFSDSEKFYLSALELPAPAGILIDGPSGCGKSTLVAEIARLCKNKYKCLTLVCTDLVHKIVGESELALVRAFQQAREMAPCLLVLDNLDIILGSPIEHEDREKDKDSAENNSEDDASDDGDGNEGNPKAEMHSVEQGAQAWQSRQRTRAPAIDRLLSTLLVEMDGLKLLSEPQESKSSDSSKEVIVIATATRVQSLDKTLLRPGRLEEHIQLSLPSDLQRNELLRIHLPLAEELEIERIVASTRDYTFASLRNVLTEAGMTVMRSFLMKSKSELSDTTALSDLKASYQQSLKAEVLNILHC